MALVRLDDGIEDTLSRIATAWQAHGYHSWDAVTDACFQGRVFKITFAKSRPLYFVKQFTSLVKASGLQLNVGEHLELYLGVQGIFGLHRASGYPASQVGEVPDLGWVDTELEPRVVLSAPSRSAGVEKFSRTPPSILDGRRVMILDDDVISRRVISRMLGREGCSVHSVGEAEAAFQNLRGDTPDIVILDVVLGGVIDGLDFCEAMRTQPKLLRTPVIFVSGHGTESVRQRASQCAGIFLEKPVKVEQLRSAVATLTA
jgi:CheY-like chemotaxis protein